jgi:hypothetical protein
MDFLALHYRTVIVVSVVVIVLLVIFVPLAVHCFGKKKPAEPIEWHPDERMRERGTTAQSASEQSSRPPRHTALILRDRGGHRCCSGGDVHPCGGKCACQKGPGNMPDHIDA